jgi:ligand-binding SRPBCC domain-containing protein
MKNLECPRQKRAQMYTLTTSQTVSADLDTVFAFFAQPENLARITPAWLDFSILTPSPISMKEGALIDYQIKLGPFPTRWRTLITAYEPGVSFVDEQLSGPYSFWHHTHRFEVTAKGTLLTDEVRYLPPLGIMGRIAHGLAIKNQLLGIFRHRHQYIADKFGGRLDDCIGPDITWS